MRAHELFERASPVLYHSTNLQAALDIVQNNEFKLSFSTGIPGEQELAPSFYSYFLSLARTPTSQFVQYTAASGRAIFVINGDWFNGRYPVKPVDYFAGGLRKPGLGKENEDRVFSKEPTIPADAITAIHVFLAAPNPFYSSLARQLLLACKTRRLPAYLYKDKQSWLRLDTKHSWEPRALRYFLNRKPINPENRKPHKEVNRLRSFADLIYKNSMIGLSPQTRNLITDLLGVPTKITVDWLRDELYSVRQVMHAGKTRNTAIRILSYMSKNKLLTLTDFVEAMRNKWHVILSQEMAKT